MEVLVGQIHVTPNGSAIAYRGVSKEAMSIIIKGYHHMCPEEQMWDPGHDWCNWDYLVECGNRPECNECDEGCP